MLLVGAVSIRGGEITKRIKKRGYNKWLETYTKRAVAIILAVSLIDLQLSYVLAFMGQVQIAESLSSTIASTVVGVMLGYFLKALFETFFEKREERLRRKEEIHEGTVDMKEG